MKRILAFAFFLLFLAGIAFVNLKAVDVAERSERAEASGTTLEPESE